LNSSAILDKEVVVEEILTLIKPLEEDSAMTPIIRSKGI